MDSLKRRVFRYFTSNQINNNELSHLIVSKYLLRFFGLWPYDNKIMKRCGYTAFAIAMLMSSATLFEGLMETTTWEPVPCFVAILGIIWLLASLMFCTSIYMRESSLKGFYDQMKYDWSVINDAEEIAIMKKFTRRAKSVFFIYLRFALIDSSLLVCLYFSPWSYESPEEYEKMMSPYPKQWIITENLYELQPAIHISLIVGYAAILFGAVIHLYLNSIYHICGVLAIVSWRLQNLPKPSKVKWADSMRHEDEVILKLLDIIDKHREAIGSTYVIERTFSVSLQILHIMGIMCLTILIFGLRLSFNTENIFLALRILPMISSILQYGIYINYAGEQIIEYSDQVFKATCTTSWESMPMKAKKIILMLILRSSKSRVLKAGLMPLSLENLKTILSVSWSSATVLFSTQKVL